MFKKITTRLKKEDIEREIKEDYEHSFYPLSDQEKQRIKEEDPEVLVQEIARRAEKHCSGFQWTYYYEYVRILREDFPWDKVIVKYIYIDEEQYICAAPNVTATIE